MCRTANLGHMRACRRGGGDGASPSDLAGTAAAPKGPALCHDAAIQQPEIMSGCPQAADYSYEATIVISP
jgi:hypothetical protein